MTLYNCSDLDKPSGSQRRFARSDVRALKHTWAGTVHGSACRDAICYEELPEHLRHQAWLHSVGHLRVRYAILDGAIWRGSCCAILRRRHQCRRHNGCLLRTGDGLKRGCERALLLSCCKRGPQSFLTKIATACQPLCGLMGVSPTLRLLGL